MNFKEWLLSEERIFNEDFKTQREKFIQQGIEPEKVDYYLDKFEMFKDKKYKEINDPIKGLEHIKDKTNINAYKTFQELKILVDYVKARLPFFFQSQAQRNKPIFNTEKDLKIKKELDTWDNRDEVPFMHRPTFKPMYTRGDLAEYELKLGVYDMSFVPPKSYHDL